MPDQPPLPACPVLPQYDPTAATSPIVNQVSYSLNQVPLVQADNTLGHLVDNTWSPLRIANWLAHNLLLITM